MEPFPVHDYTVDEFDDEPSEESDHSSDDDYEPGN
jgi:hypothetical protein